MSDDIAEAQEWAGVCDHIAAVCWIYGVPRAYLLGPSRELWLRPARRELAWRLITDTRPLSLPQAGRVMHRDHSTVLTAARAHSTKHFGTGPKATIDEMRKARWE